MASSVIPTGDMHGSRKRKCQDEAQKSDGSPSKKLLSIFAWFTSVGEQKVKADEGDDHSDESSDEDSDDDTDSQSSLQQDLDYYIEQMERAEGKIADLRNEVKLLQGMVDVLEKEKRRYAGLALNLGHATSLFTTEVSKIPHYGGVKGYLLARYEENGGKVERKSVLKVDELSHHEIQDCEYDDEDTVDEDASDDMSNISDQY